MDNFDDLRKKMFESDEFKKMKDQITNCIQEIQIHMSKNMTPDESYKKLREMKFDTQVIDLAMMLLKKMHDEGNPIHDSITKHMVEINDDISDIKDVKDFYQLISTAYLDKFMQDKETRGMPITFLYNSNKDNKIGIVPMNTTDHSPMDDLKEVVYRTNPEAYLFCGEASMLKMDKDEFEEADKSYKYGDIQENEKSIDVVILQGNDRCNKNQLSKVYDLKVLEDGKIEFNEREFNNEVTSNKLP
jgi:hypothetical protein